MRERCATQRTIWLVIWSITSEIEAGGWNFTYYPDRSLTERERACLMSARESSVEGELEFDEATVVSDSSDEPGAYVLGWYWIDEVSCGSGS